MFVKAKMDAAVIVHVLVLAVDRVKFMTLVIVVAYVAAVAVVDVSCGGVEVQMLKFTWTHKQVYMQKCT